MTKWKDEWRDGRKRLHISKGSALSSSAGQCYLASMGVSSAAGDLVFLFIPQLSAGLACPHHRGTSFLTPAPVLASDCYTGQGS